MKWNDFLNPRSMLTPGVAGGMVMLIANTLWVEFTIPQKWTALILSFLLIIPILMRFAATVIENIIYFTFNGLIVFSLSINANFAGGKIQKIASRDNTHLLSQSPDNFISHVSENTHAERIQFAFNQANKTLQKGPIFALKVRQSDATNEKESQSNNKKKEKKYDKDDRKFFDNWFQD